MSQSHINSMAVAGPEDRLAAYLVSAFAPLNVDWDAREPTRVDGTFPTSGPGFALVEEASKWFPELVFRVSSVDSANGFAKAWVLRDGDTVGEYDMPSDEFEETAGEELDEEALLDNLDATVEAYLHDELEAIAVRAPGR